MLKTLRVGLFVVLLTAGTLGPQAHAAISPLGVAIIPPVQFPPADFSVVGARLSLLWGEHRDVYGLDLGGLGNVTNQTFAGIGIAGGANITRGQTTVLGLQLAGLANVNIQKTSIYGLQATAGLNMNTAETTVVGFQIAGLGNYSPFTKLYGVQVGLYNRAHEVYGFQFGLVNVADTLHGIQIGLINFNHTGLFAVAPILNIGF